MLGRGWQPRLMGCPVFCCLMGIKGSGTDRNAQIQVENSGGLMGAEWIDEGIGGFLSTVCCFDKRRCCVNSSYT
jgi:hypothetical protein